MATPSNPTIPEEPTPRIPLVRILIGAIMAAIAAAVANGVIFLIGDAAGSFPNDVTFEGSNGEAMSIELGSVIGGSIIAVMAAGIVFAVISRLSSRPERLFSMIALVLLILSFIPPFTIPDAPGDMIVALLLMHLVGGAIAIWTLTRWIHR